MDPLRLDYDPGIPKKPGGQEGVLHSDVWDYWKRLNEYTPPSTVRFRTERYKHAYSVVMTEPDNLLFQQETQRDEDENSLHMNVNGLIIVHGKSIAAILKMLTEKDIRSDDTGALHFSKLLQLSKEQDAKELAAVLMRIQSIVSAFGTLALKVQQRGRLDALTNRRTQPVEGDASGNGDVQ